MPRQFNGQNTKLRTLRWWFDSITRRQNVYKSSISGIGSLMVESLAVNQSSEGSSPFQYPKNLKYSYLIVFNSWLVDIMVIMLDCLSGYRSSILLRVAKVLMQYQWWWQLNGKASDCGSDNEGSIPFHHPKGFLMCSNMYYC